MLTQPTQQDLLEIASDMATELRCMLLDTVGGGPQTDYTKSLLHRYEYLQAKIHRDLESQVESGKCKAANTHGAENE